MTEQPRIVVLTALGLEYQALHAYLLAPHMRVHPRGTLFEVGRPVSCGWHLALAETGVGNRSAAIVTERAIDMFGPVAIFFVGVAGALREDVELGDVVVATKVYDYHGGMDTDDGFMAYPQSWEAPHGLAQVARHIARAASWVRTLQPGSEGRIPTVHFRPIAAGEVVLNSRNTALARQLRHTYHDAAAIEMESAGAAFAAHVNRTSILTVRGISDKADGHKHVADSEGFQRVAARNAAAFTIAVIAAFTAPGLYRAG